MPNTTNNLYTYRNGKKVYLIKEQDQFVVRATLDVVENMGLEGSLEQVSLHSTRVSVISDL